MLNAHQTQRSFRTSRMHLKEKVKRIYKYINGLMKSIVLHDTQIRLSMIKHKFCNCWCIDIWTNKYRYREFPSLNRHSDTFLKSLKINTIYFEMKIFISFLSDERLNCLTRLQMKTCLHFPSKMKSRKYKHIKYILDPSRRQLYPPPPTPTFSSENTAFPPILLIIFPWYYRVLQSRL